MKNSTLNEERARRLCDRWGVPYWKDATKYPKGKIRNEEWRWEFLRRDKDYREDWHKQCIGEFSEVEVERLIKYGLVQLQDPTKSYRELRTKIVFQNYPLILNAHGDIEWEYYDIDEKQDDEIYRALEREGDKDHLVEVRFDMTQPLTPQIERLRSLLEKKQKKVNGKLLRHRISDETVLYLRATDALLVGVSPTDIGKEIFGCRTKPSAATRGQQVKNKIKKIWQHF